MSESQIVNYRVAVRALCEFTARRGDLDLRFTPSPSAQEGMAGHATIAARRGKHYEAEVSLAGAYKNLAVRGRADGYDVRHNRVEEVKTFRGDLDTMPENHRLLHWAQAKMYGWLLCQSRQLAAIDVALVYFDIMTQKETMLIESYEASGLQAFFEQQCELFIAWAGQESLHRAQRDDALTALRFPHTQFRTGQRELAEAVYKSALTGRCLMAQASTGIGKTIGTIFSLLKAAPAQKIDKIFFLSAKTSGRGLALDALNLLRHATQPLTLRVLEMVARDKACEHPDKACHGQSCPLAHGFYDRLAAARQAAAEVALLDQAGLRNIALLHQVCPYYLSVEMARWSDVVIGDYNYYFDSSAMLYGLTTENQWRVGLLVDEAHNMVERARKMYSAELDQQRLGFVRKAAPKALKTALDRVNRQWNALYAEQSARYQVYASIADKFVFALKQASIEIADFMAEQPDTVGDDLQRFYFDLLQFVKQAEAFGEHSLFDVTLSHGGGDRRQALLCLRNVVPAPFLQARFDTAHCATLFSATLSPWHFYADMLGLPPDVVWMNAASPFAPTQLTVHVARDISTRYKDRGQSLAAIVALIGRQYAAQPGNYLAFFSSFDYLEQVRELFIARFPDIPVWHQARRMDEPERKDFLQRFSEQGSGIGFAVLGGVFSEGIDLPGTRLIGAFIATLGLPQVNDINEQMRQRMHILFGEGYDYIYLFPGLQKVVQAAGRVIRTRHDSGTIHLMDDRFARKQVQALLPDWWQLSR